MNQLFQGDNLEILHNMPGGSVDLICTDPPFNTGKDWGAFDDRWEGGLDGYLKFMEPRLIECRRVLKDTGSLYLHCDPTASHYLKVMLDGVFGIKQFRNEIVWQRTSSNNSGEHFGRVHDIILSYSKSDNRVWHDIHTSHNPNYIESHYVYSDEFGAYRNETLKARGTTQNGESGKAWMGVDPSETGHHWSAPKRHSLPTQLDLPDDYDDLSVHERLDILYEKGIIVFPKTGKIPRVKHYLSVSKGRKLTDIMTDIGVLQACDKQKVGYPTQKPVALYERMIKASSNQHDIVLDPFAGSGTTLDAAHTLGRHWIGIDIGDAAIETIQERMRNRHGLEYDRDYEIIRGT